MLHGRVSEGASGTPGFAARQLNLWCIGCVVTYQMKFSTLRATVVRSAVAATLSWGITAVCFTLHSNRSIVSMALVLEVLAVATLGDWLLAVLTSICASLAFSWYFVDSTGSLKIS